MPNGSNNIRRRRRIDAGVSLPLADARIDSRRVNDLLTNAPDIHQLKNRVPLMLMPLRLEYRFVKARQRPKLEINQDLVEMTKRFEALADLLPPGKKKTLRNRFIRENSLNAGSTRRPRFVTNGTFTRLATDKPDAVKISSATTLATAAFDQLKNTPALVSKIPLSFFETHLLMRWYPDENFSEKGVAEPNDEELIALEELNTTLGGKNWWDTEDMVVSAAWQSFAAEVGSARAVHLKRTEGGADNPDWEQRIGRISALPERVAIFGIVGGSPTLLSTGKLIPPNHSDSRSPVSYTPEALGGSGNNEKTWLNSFNEAIKQGMAVKITTKGKVALAKSADWIVAVGLHHLASTDGTGALDTSSSEIEAMLKGRIANGEFAFLAQDSNTNNIPNQPTEYRQFESDVLSFTLKTTASERGAFSGGNQAAADLFAEAIGVNPAELQKAIRADDSGFQDARAMIQVIGPALLDDALDGSTLLNGVDENAFINVLAGGVMARGALPAVRFGSSAYGVMPIADVATMAAGHDEQLNSSEQKVHQFLSTYAQSSRSILPGFASFVTPVMRPETDNLNETFESVLKNNRVSTRIEVADSKVDPDEAKNITCPYVSGHSETHRPTSYLQKLRTAQIKSLPDPRANDLSWPLLYRLARISLTYNTQVLILGNKLGIKQSIGLISKPDRQKKAAIKIIDDLLDDTSVTSLAKTKHVETLFKTGRIDGLRISRINAQFAKALRHLEKVAARPNGTAELEILMLEVIDLFQHRIDAFAVGLAYLQLKRDRSNGTKGLAKGYYGILGKLRPDSATGESDGYLLAPSTPQAVTSAVMRSAYLRHKAEGAFAIDLSSGRVRRALKLLDILSKGHSLSEALGMRGERKLHETREDAQILPLRLKHPITDENGSGTAGSRVFDGLAFIESTGSSGNAVRTALKKQLADDLDAFTDIIMAEASHQRAMGSSEVANAWLNVMSGDPPPGRPTFLRTQRNGHASTHKVSLLRKPVNARNSAGPREIAEPTLAAMAVDTMPDFDSAKIAVSANVTANNASPGRLEIRLQTDLQLAPIDLVIGGASELQVRAKQFIIRSLLEDPQALNDLNAQGDAASFAQKLSGLSVDLDHGSVSVSEYLKRAEQVRKLAQGSRPVDPTDLNAMAPAEHGLLTEAEEIDMVEHAVATLNSRIERLISDLESKVANATSALNSFETVLFQAAASIENDAASTNEVTNAVAQAELGRRNLLSAFVGLAVYGEPTVLKVILLEEALATDGSSSYEPFRQALQRLAGRCAVLKETKAKPIAGFTKLPVARACLYEHISALRTTLDGDALPILPPYPRNLKKLQPNFTARVALATALPDWSRVRQKVGDLLTLAQFLPGTSVLPVAADATLDDSDDPTAALRTEEEAPRSLHVEHTFGPRDEIKSQSAITGFVADEWSEARPSNIQAAGLAISYDSPQSEPPHCILLGVPGQANMSHWTLEEAAGIANEAIAWMQIRPLSSVYRIAPAALFPNANQVAAKNQRKSGRRIPDKKPARTLFDWVIGDGEFSTVADTSSRNLGVAGAGITERTGFSKLRE